MIRKILFTLLLTGAGLPAFPQPPADSTFVADAIANTRQRYKTAIGVQARLYNGSRYKPPPYTVEEHPFFSSEDWITGNVFYDGEYFQDVPLMLDLYNQQLITEHLSSGQPIQLVMEKIQRFTIAGHHFEKATNALSGLPDEGFYEVLYPGKTKVLVKRKKLLREKIERTAIDRSYEERNRYFILKDGVFMPVKTKASVLKVLANRKQALKRFLKTQPRPFSIYRERTLKNLASYYDTL